MKSRRRIRLYFLVPAVFIVCLVRVSDTSSESQSEALIQAPASGQPTQSKAPEEIPLEVAARMTVDEGGGEFRVIYDRNHDKCTWQLAENFPGAKERTRIILVDDCVYPYLDYIHAYISGWDRPLIMLRRGLGDPCPAMYRILEFPEDEKGIFTVTESFGNCNPNTTLFFDGKKLVIKLKSHYLHPDRYSSPGTWVYSNRKLREITTKRRRK